MSVDTFKKMKLWEEQKKPCSFWIGKMNRAVRNEQLLTTPKTIFLDRFEVKNHNVFNFLLKVE